MKTCENIVLRSIQLRNIKIREKPPTPVSNFLNVRKNNKTKKSWAGPTTFRVYLKFLNFVLTWQNTFVRWFRAAMLLLLTAYINETTVNVPFSLCEIPTHFNVKITNALFSSIIEALAQCWADVGPSSTTLKATSAQHWAKDYDCPLDTRQPCAALLDGLVLCPLPIWRSLGFLDWNSGRVDTGRNKSKAACNYDNSYSKR